MWNMDIFVAVNHEALSSDVLFLLSYIWILIGTFNPVHCEGFLIGKLPMTKIGMYLNVYFVQEAGIWLKLLLYAQNTDGCKMSSMPNIQYTFHLFLQACLSEMMQEGPIFLSWILKRLTFLWVLNYTSIF